MLGLLLLVAAAGVVLRVDGGGSEGTLDVEAVATEAPPRPPPGGKDPEPSPTPVEDVEEPAEPDDDAEPVAPEELVGEWDPVPVGGPRGHGVAATWTGRQLIAVGGVEMGDGPRAVYTNAARGYDAGTDRWVELPVPPLAERAEAGSVWTGELVAVWGGAGPSGHHADGALYDPARRRWTAMAAGPLSGRSNAHLLWTGREILVVGGYDNAGPAADAAAYDPATRRWRQLPPPPEPMWEVRGTVDGDIVHLWTPDRGLLTHELGTAGWESSPPLPGRHDELLVGVASAGGRVHVVAQVDHSARAGPVLRLRRLADGKWVPLGPPLEVSVGAAGDLVPTPTGLALMFPEGRYAAAFLDLGSLRWSVVKRSAGAAQGWRAEAAWTGDRLVVWGGDTQPEVFASIWRPTP